MPQLDGYLIFSEIFWFTILFGLTYLVVYRAVARLHLGLRTRWAFLAGSAGFGSEFRLERKVITGSWHTPLEHGLLDFDTVQAVLGEQTVLLREQTSQLGLATAEHLVAGAKSDVNDLPTVSSFFIARALIAQGDITTQSLANDQEAAIKSNINHVEK